MTTDPRVEAAARELHRLEYGGATDWDADGSLHSAFYLAAEAILAAADAARVVPADVAGLVEYVTMLASRFKTLAGMDEELGRTNTSTYIENRERSEWLRRVAAALTALAADRDEWKAAADENAGAWRHELTMRETAERDKRFIIDERDRTFALMLARAETAERLVAEAEAAREAAEYDGTVQQCIEDLHAECNQLQYERGEITRIIGERFIEGPADGGALIEAVKEMRDALAEAERRLAVATAALREIARQKRTDELETEYEVLNASFDDGYDLCVDRARAAYAEITGEARDAD